MNWTVTDISVGVMHQVSGFAVILFSLVIDAIYPGTPGFGIIQYAGIVVGCVLVLTGLREVFAPDVLLWKWVLFIVYGVGIVFIGMMPSLPGAGKETILILSVDHFSGTDFFINVFGFLPFGYLLMTCLAADKQSHPGMKLRNPAWLVLLAGVCTSLGIELCQHWFVPGRFSSLYDWLANTLGTLLGINLYRLTMFRKDLFRSQVQQTKNQIH